MIASHDSFTYQKPTNWLLNLIKIFWKAQDKNIDQQYKAGVRIFDVRIASDKSSGNLKWRTAHGIAKFNITFNTIESICQFFEQHYKGSIIRIFLEDKELKENIKEEYCRQANIAYVLHKDMIWEIGTHYPWERLYVNNTFTIKEYYCHLFNWDPNRSFWKNVKKMDLTSWSLPYYAKRHNPKITQKMIEDPDVMHIMDYV